MEQSCRNNIAIVGAGPAGIYCALNLVFGFSELGFSDYSVTIFDKSNPLKTILPTGGARCNITNAIYDIKDFCSNYPRGEKFLYSLFSRHFNYDCLEFFKKIGINTYVQDDGRIFPVSNSSFDVREKMLCALKGFKNVKIVQKEIKDAKEIEKFNFKVISAGSRETLNLIKSFKVPFIPFRRALCALKIKDFNFPQGVSVKSSEGEFVFTQDGISGPLAFKISSIHAFDNFPYEISINLFDEEDLYQLTKENPKKSIGSLLSSFIPKSLAKAMVKDYSQNAAEISYKSLKEYSKLNLTVIGNSQNGEIVHAGGINLDYLDKNCKSKGVKNLWFCGEILNIDGFCGGFNLQNCWSSAYVVAKDIISFIINK